VLFAFLFGPHGAKECVTSACNGPNFVSPMISTFLMPNWLMNLSFTSWMLQLFFALPLILVLYIVYRIMDSKYGKFLEIYVIRWGLLYCVIVLYYNMFFWGGLREYLFPYFIF
jgi:hypothetical protein